MDRECKIMKILLRENDGKVWALDPETGFNLTVIPVPAAWCYRNIERNYPRGAIYWDSWENARSELRQHEIITDDTIFDETPINPAALPAKEMTIRQVYKCSAMEALIAAKYPGRGIEDRGRKMLAAEVGELADAMIEEDRQHEAKGK